MSEVNQDTLFKAEELFIRLVGDVIQIIEDAYGLECAANIMDKYRIEKVPDEDEPGKAAREFMEFLEALFKVKQ